MHLREATTADWPLNWPFLQQIVAAGDTFTYNPEMGEAEAMWMVDAPGRVIVAAVDSGQVSSRRSIWP